MTNLDFWNNYVGEDSAESFLRNYGSTDPELCVQRFLEERGNLYGVVSRGSWVGTFEAADQHHRPTVQVYLLSYLEDTRAEWQPALEATPPSIPRRYREKFDQDRFPPPDSGEGNGEAEEAGSYGTYVPDTDDNISEAGAPLTDAVATAAPNSVADARPEIESEQGSATEAVPAPYEDATDSPDVDAPIADAPRTGVASPDIEESAPADAPGEQSAPG